eukprot:4202531-Amphidinium_carterae.1
MARYLVLHKQIFVMCQDKAYRHWNGPASFAEAGQGDGQQATAATIAGSAVVWGGIDASRSMVRLGCVLSGLHV